MNNFAKTQAQMLQDDLWMNPTGIVSYQSSGFVLIVGDSVQQTQRICEQLAPEFTCYCLVENEHEQAIANTWHGFLVELSGYLGSFAVVASIDSKVQDLMADKKANKYFDIIIDLTQKIEIAPVPPFGYYALEADIENDGIFVEINQLIGTFDKPQYFNLDTTLCVHSRNKIELCSRCIEACPANAISSDGDNIKVNPNLCQGCGGCSSVCPTGAISYAYPAIIDNAKKMHALVGTYLKHGGQKAELFFYKADNTYILPKLNDNILPMAVEEIGFIGLESLLYAFCLGVECVTIHCVNEPKQMRQTLQKQINLTHKILQNLTIEVDNSFVQLIDDNLQTKKIKNTALINTMGLIELYNKRNRIFAMVDFLWLNQTNQSLPACDFNNADDAYFGEIIIDKNLCTVCMACTSVCPSKALTSGNINTPIVNFQEDLCVQCGLCMESCPEDAVELNARLIFDGQQRTKIRTLNQDEPFKCIDCGKVFGSSQVVQKMMTKLENHSMFADGKLNNLKRCEDCRVKSLF